jgi:hypothetical protein
MHTSFGRAFSIGILALMGLSALACSAAPESSDVGAGCKPAKEYFCRCVNRASGSKVCNDDKKTYSECDCGGAEADAPAASSGLGAPDDPGADPAGGGRKGDPVVVTPPDADPAQDPAAAPSDAPPKAAPKCAKLENIASKTSVVSLLDDSQAPTGGTIAKGTYVQTWVVQFRGAKGSVSAKTFESAQTLELNEDFGRFTVEENAQGSKSAGFAYEVVGRTLTLTPQCPAGPAKSFEFSASGTELVVFDGDWVRTFERQEAATEETP